MSTPTRASGELVVPEADEGDYLPSVPSEWSSMLMAVPEASEDEDAYLRILAQLAGAETATELDAPWSTDKLDAYEGQELVITELRRRPSDYQTGLGWYLLCAATVRSTGERITLPVGGVGPVAQLVKAYALHLLPLTVTVRGPRKPTRKGYRPMHFEVVR